MTAELWKEGIWKLFFGQKMFDNSSKQKILVVSFESSAKTKKSLEALLWTVESSPMKRRLLRELWKLFTNRRFVKVLRWIEEFCRQVFYMSSLKTKFLQENLWKNFMDIKIKLSYEKMPLKSSSMDRSPFTGLLSKYGI